MTSKRFRKKERGGQSRKKKERNTRILPKTKTSVHIHTHMHSHVQNPAKNTGKVEQDLRAS